MSSYLIDTLLILLWIGPLVALCPIVGWLAENKYNELAARDNWHKDEQ